MPRGKSKNTDNMALYIYTKGLGYGYFSDPSWNLNYFRQHSGTYQAHSKFGAWLFSWIIFNLLGNRSDLNLNEVPSKTEGRLVRQSTIPTTIQHISRMFYIHTWNFWSVLFYDSDFFFFGKSFLGISSWFIPLGKTSAHKKSRHFPRSQAIRQLLVSVCNGAVRSYWSIIHCSWQLASQACSSQASTTTTKKGGNK